MTIHPKRTIQSLIASAVALTVATVAHGEGFSDSDVLFYGEVRQVGGAGTVLLQAGTLQMTITNQSDIANTVVLSAELRPTGTADHHPFSYGLRVPLRYLPEAGQKGSSLSVGVEESDFRISEISVDGRPATLPDGSLEFFPLSFASRSSQHRLDLIVAGDSTDTDGDGLPDWWENLYGMDPHNPADALADLDSDGWNNLEEFKRGSSPAASNTRPQLATAEILVPQSGETGLFVHVLDSNSTPADIHLAFAPGTGDGFAVKFDGVVLDGTGAQDISLEDIQAGRLSIAHTDPARSQLTLPVSWDDGGEPAAGQLLVRVSAPSLEDGSDAGLWLDGADLPPAGTPIGNWNDRSGNGRHAMQPLPEHQPVSVERSADFATSPTAHLFFQDAGLPRGDHTVFVAYHSAAESDVVQTLLSSNRGFLQLAPTSQALSYPGAARYQMDGLAVRGFEDGSGVTSTSIFRREGQVVRNIFGLSYDGESVMAEPIDPVLPTIGARRAAIPNGSLPTDLAFSGQLHELLIFPTALPEQKLRDVHDYLESKWRGAVIWDLSTELKDIELTASTSQRHIIRGGHGADRLGGGPLADIISGGAGADTLSGGGGADRFVYGGVDTGRDVITDFDMEADIIDLSALFWGQRGDARQFISVRLDTNFSTPIPTLDSVLIVQRPDGGEQEIVLRDSVVGGTQLVQLIVEGRLRMGSLSIPGEVRLALGSGASGAPLRERLNQPFTIVVTRSGEGIAAALDVPLGYFADALGNDLVLEGASFSEGQRAVVQFARGEISKTLTVRPVPDLVTEGVETWQVAVLPHYKYAVGGVPVEQTVEDIPNLWLEVLQANAVADIDQPARVRVHRDGDLAQGLTLNFNLGGTAEEGVHIGEMPHSFTIPAGAASADLQLNARAEGLTGGAKTAVLSLQSCSDFQLGNPHEAILYAAMTTGEAQGIGFDRWLQASTDGAITSLADLVRIAPQQARDYLRAYAFGLGSVEELKTHHVDLRLVDGRPEITAAGSFDAADVRWGVQASGDLDDWSDATNTFVEVPSADGLKLVGEPLAPGELQKFYRIDLSLDPGQLAGTQIVALTGATRFGISGDAAWSTDQATGDLRSSGGSPGEQNRLIAEVATGALVEFKMELLGGAGDALAFYIDGIQIAETDGAPVHVREQLAGSGAHLLMWQFRSGQAVIGPRSDL